MKVELMPLMTAVMRILKVQPEDVLQEALDRDFINNTEEEITNIFMLELMRKVEVICIERFNALGKGRIEIMF